MTEQAYFLTVDWCKKGYRGIFCDKEGCAFRKDGEPHTELETQEILGPFWIILASQSELFTAEQLSQFNRFVPLAEYCHQFGVALKPKGDQTPEQAGMILETP